MESGFPRRKARRVNRKRIAQNTAARGENTGAA
jgi:hypothetical protein